MSYPYKVSAVICSYNRARFIISAIESIFRQDFDKRLYEVIVVDNNSTDNTLRLLQNFKAVHPQYNFNFFTETNQGVAWARTRCAKEAKGEIVAYLDDDSEAQPGWLSSMVTFFDAHPDVFSLGGRIIPHFLVDIPDWYSKYFFGLVGTFDQGDEIKQLKGERYPCGANMAFRKKTFDRLGYFNTLLGRSGKGLLATEEKDMYKRILAANYKVYYLPDMWVLHTVEANKFDLDYVHRHSMGIGGGERMRLQRKYGLLVKKFVEYIAKLVYAFLYGLGYLAKGHWSKFKMLTLFRWWVIEGFLFPERAG